MTAPADLAGFDVVPLGASDLQELQPILDEESRAWAEELDWDYRGSVEVLRPFVQSGSVTGYVLRADGHTVGFAYAVPEPPKCLIGDLYVLRAYRSESAETLLLEAVLHDVFCRPWLRRVECQLMLLERPLERRLPFQQYARRYPRSLMAIDPAQALDLPVHSEAARYRLEHWSSAYQFEAASVIATAYRNHVDAEVNDQYRTRSGALRFLTNLLVYSGCGIFCDSASYLAFDSSDRLVGLCLVSLVRPDVGHITQVSVIPEVQGRGVGYELIRRSLVAVKQLGCRKVTLTVTNANSRARELYTRMGFTVQRRFAAYVWER